MRMRVGLTAVVLGLCVATVRAQECETFQECVAGMCANGQCVGVPLNSGSCDDFNACTMNDSCVNGECMGTPVAGGACNDFQECTLNDVCTDFFGTIVCMGTQEAEEGTRCAGDCGTCEFLVEGAPLFCLPDPERVNAPCAPLGVDSPCIVGSCTATGVPPFQIAFCGNTRAKTCPDDGNLCTGEFCNFETGECETAPLPIQQGCFPAECHRCVAETGQCVPMNVGGSCDDGNVCTSSTTCSAEGSCVAGLPPQTATPTSTTGGNTPTPTATTGQGSPTSTVAVNTATPTRTPGTPTSTPTQGRCVGDCDSSGRVQVNELVTGVNIALDRAELAACPQFDTNASSSVEVNELVLGVNSLLRGCVAPSAALSQ